MKKLILIALLLISVTVVFAQSKPSKGVKKQTKIEAAKLHSLEISDFDLNIILNSVTTDGLVNYLMTTKIPADNIPGYKAYLPKLVERLQQQQYDWTDADKAIADSVAQAKVVQDSISKAKIKK